MEEELYIASVCELVFFYYFTVWSGLGRFTFRMCACTSCGHTCTYRLENVDAGIVLFFFSSVYFFALFGQEAVEVCVGKSSNNVWG